MFRFPFKRYLLMLGLCMWLLEIQNGQARAATTRSTAISPHTFTTKGTAATAVHPAVISPVSVLGIVADTQQPFVGLPWVRVGYGTCFDKSMEGTLLKTTISQFHSQGVRVLLSLCQWATDSQLFNTRIVHDAAQGEADAVQCGNEQMKSGSYNRYVPPAIFAKFFDMCQQAMHAVRPGIPIILGALDPHVGGVDYYPLLQQVHYLNAMQDAMNTSMHPGGHWNCRSQIV